MDLSTTPLDVLRQQCEELEQQYTEFLQNETFHKQVVEFISVQRQLAAYIDELNRRGEFI
jgi:hypothetical protein